jgi:hypothetical protein
VAVELAERLAADLGLDSVAAIGAEITTVCGDGSSFTVADTGSAPPVVNNYDFRLLVDRDLYDTAVFTARSPSLADLPRGAAVGLNPWDADRRGFAEGTPVQVIAARTSTVLPARPDGRVPRGVARIVANQPGGSAAELIDITLPVNDVRLEPVEPL